MLVSINDLQIVKDIINKQDYISLDTETTGLEPFGNSEMFGMAISTEHNDYYFNFNGLSDDKNSLPLPKYVLPKDCIKELLKDYKGYIFMHNSKFDMAFLEKEGLDVFKINFICSLTGARIEYNDRLSYSLDTLGKELGYNKLDTVKKYISKNKLYNWKTTKGKKKRTKIPYYQLVPLIIIQEYAEVDARITYKLGKRILAKLTDKEYQVLEMEQELQKVLLKMEKRGIKIDIAYTKKAVEYYQDLVNQCIEEFEQLTGFEFVDSGKALAEVFDSIGEKYPRTEKGNPCFNDKALQNMDSRLAKILQKYRKYYKKLNSYFNNFVELSGEDRIIHCNFHPAGTATGRFSCSNPNLQNLNKEDKEEHTPVRKCFIPRKDYKFVMFDYDQMEYRLMLDYAGELELIEQIKSGLDVHTATAELVGITREQAKTLNFMLLYGGGEEKLAGSLKLSLKEAKALKKKYFSKMPNVKKLMREVPKVAKQRGWIRNWLGRRYYFEENYYKATNYLIQGGCADIIKLAMIEIDKLLNRRKSNMLVTIHDEILCEIHKDEVFLVSQIASIMQTIYKPRYISLSVGIDYSEQSWHDKEAYSNE